MDNEDSVSDLIRFLMEGEVDFSLIQKVGLEKILKRLIKYCDQESICCRYSDDDDGWRRWKNTEDLLRKAREAAFAPELTLTEEPLDPVHAEAVKRFLSRLSGNALAALGVPARLRVEISEGQVTPAGAEISGGWHEPYSFVYLEQLILIAPTYEHYCALATAHDVWTKAARGLFRGLTFQYPGGRAGFSIAVPNE